MNKFLKLMMAAGDGSGGGTGETNTKGTGSTPTFGADFKDPEIRENFTKMFPGMDSAEKLAKTAIEQQRLIGTKGVQLPGKPEEVVPWLQTHLKAPKDGKGYNFDKLNVPEALKAHVNVEALKGFSENFAKRGLTQEQAQGVIEDFYGHTATEMSQADQARNDLAAKSKVALQKEWGGDFDKNVTAATMALTTLGGPELAEAVTKSGLHNDANFIKFLHNAAGLMKEDTASGLSKGGFAGGSEQARQEIEQLYGDPEFTKVYFNQNDPGFKAASERMKRLYEVRDGLLGRKKV